MKKCLRAYAGYNQLMAFCEEEVIMPVADDIDDCREAVALYEDFLHDAITHHESKDIIAQCRAELERAKTELKIALGKFGDIKTTLEELIA